MEVCLWLTLFLNNADIIVAKFFVASSVVTRTGPSGTVCLFLGKCTRGTQSTSFAGNSLLLEFTSSEATEAQKASIESDLVVWALYWLEPGCSLQGFERLFYITLKPLGYSLVLSYWLILI